MARTLSKSTCPADHIVHVWYRQEKTITDFKVSTSPASKTTCAIG